MLRSMAGIRGKSGPPRNQNAFRHGLAKQDLLSPILAAALITGCAATQIINQRSNPDYTLGSFKKILVIGVSKQTNIRRTFEDEFVAQLKALDAVPSYALIPE